MIELSGPPDLIKAGQTDPHAIAKRMRVFQVQQIWAGTGYEANGASYRAKVTIWAYSQGETPLAELYFHDDGSFEPTGQHKSSEPEAARGVVQHLGPPEGPHQIHFPMSTFAPIIALMRSANEPVYLFYFKGEWAIGTSLSEAIGSE